MRDYQTQQQQQQHRQPHRLLSSAYDFQMLLLSIEDAFQLNDANTTKEAVEMQ